MINLSTVNMEEFNRSFNAIKAITAEIKLSKESLKEEKGDMAEILGVTKTEGNKIVSILLKMEEGTMSDDEDLIEVARSLITGEN